MTAVHEKMSPGATVNVISIFNVFFLVFFNLEET